MSEAPKCRICGHHHWLSEPHKWSEDCASLSNAQNAVPKHISAQETPSMKKTGKSPHSEQPNSSPHAQIAPRKRAQNGTFDRKSYMREYMKLYRRNEPKDVVSKES